ncbi:MAG: hypothetical protein GY719_30970, partial [bacterium]|nr:hypothetical protein [bacterium]
EDVTYNWTYVLSQTERARVTTFDVALPGMRPGEVRQVGSGTVVSYTTAGGHGVATLPPLYVAAAHLVSIAPPARETNPGGAASYQVTLYNPQASADVFTLALEGLPTGWTTGTFGVPIGAGAKVVVPVTVSVPADAALDDYVFAATVETSSGGQDSAQARLTVADMVEMSIAPPLHSAGNGETVAYTLTVTNLEAVSRTYTLSIGDGLAGNGIDLPATLDVGAGSSATAEMQVTALDIKGLYPFRVTAAYEDAATGQIAQAGAEAALIVLSELGVEAGIDPGLASGGQGSPAAYTLIVTNTGTLADVYDLEIGLPDGWSAELSANGAQVSEVELPPYLFNAAPLQLAVIPAANTPAGTYTLVVTATSQTCGELCRTADTRTRATATGTTIVSPRGVSVQIEPQSATMDPTDTHTWDVTVHNTGQGVDTFDLMPGGIISITGQFSANPVTLDAGESAVVQLTAGPLPFVLPQTYPIAVTAVSQGDDDVFGYDTAELTFSGFEDVDVTLLPSSLIVTDTLRASYLVVVTNTGNVDTVYHLSALPSALSLQFETSEIYVPPHMTAGILLTARAGAPGSYTFSVRADSASGPATDASDAHLTIVFSNRPPEVDAGPDLASDEGVEVALTGS